MLTGLLVVPLQPRLAPATAAAGTTAVLASAATAILGALVTLTIVFVAEVPVTRRVLRWCAAFAGARSIPWWLGAAVTAALAAGVVSAAVTIRRLRPAPVGDLGEGELVVLPHDAPAAFAVPGRGGHVVVSTGMLSCLDHDERRVLLAHERAHLSRSHHRYLYSRRGGRHGARAPAPRAAGAVGHGAVGR